MKTRQQGFTLIELLVAVATMITLMSLVASMVQGTVRGRATTTRLAHIREEGRRALEIIVRELRHANAASLLLTQDNKTGTGQMDFVLPTGVSGDQITWSSPVQYAYGEEEEFRYGGRTEAEVRTERVTVGRLMRRQDGHEKVLCNHVREGGFYVSPGEAGNFHLQIELAIVDPMGRLLTTTVETSVTVRNNIGS